MHFESNFWAGKRVSITGHLGFKGTWLTMWLLDMGAIVSGYSLENSSDSTMSKQVNLKLNGEELIGDIREKDQLKDFLLRNNPEFIFAFAAQASVSESFVDPIFAWSTNVIGTLNIIESIKEIGHPCVVIFATTDKVYLNDEDSQIFDENSRLGGNEPYSASKASSELVVSSCRAAYSLPASNMRVATVRAGNVIGGGDWMKNRISPDIVRSSESNIPLVIRNPKSIRPWQFVLDCLNGYLLLAEQLFLNSDLQLQSAFNFSSKIDDQLPVIEIVKKAKEKIAFAFEFTKIDALFPESKILHLNSNKSAQILGWSPKLTIDQAIDLTFDWYRAYLSGGNLRDKTLSQIRKYAKYEI